jgi:hypothetical protein
MNPPCNIETGLFKKKPCGQPSLTKCANCEQPLCKQHAVAQKKAGVFMCKDCDTAEKQFGKNQAKLEKEKREAEMLKSLANPGAPKPRPPGAAPAAPAAPARPAAVPARPAAAGAAPAPAQPAPKPADDAPLEFTPSDKTKK